MHFVWLVRPPDSSISSDVETNPSLTSLSPLLSCGPCLDCASIDNKRILCRIVGIAGSKEKPGYKLRCLYAVLKGL